MDQPIGVIDSGVGGLTVASELIRQLPKEQLIYLGDTNRCPYGSRTREEIIQFTWEMVAFLRKRNIKMLVVACNTATAFTLNQLRDELDIPVVGVIQAGARAAIKMTENMHIGVIGTEGTIKSQAYVEALKRINSSIHVSELSCAPFVPMVEQGILEGSKAMNVVTQTLQPMKEMNPIDTLVLGCTHYPLIRDTIQQVMGSQVTLISSGEEIAREVSTILGYHEKLFNGERRPRHKFYTTGSLRVFKDIAEDWLQHPIDVINTVTLENYTM